MSKAKPSKPPLDFKLEVGDIIFGAKKGPLSWWLRVLFGPFSYSHVSMAGEPIDGHPTIYTTGIGGGPGITKEGDGPKFLPATRFRQVYAGDYLANKRYVVCRYQNGLSTDQKETILKWCKSQIGRRFPYRKTFKFLGAILGGKGVDETRAKGQDGLYTCYEAIAAAYAKIGVELTPRAGNKNASGYDIKEIYLSPHLKNVYTNQKSL